MRIVLWGTYDTGKPRTRILRRGLKECGCLVSECHADIWAGVEDKSQIVGWKARLGLLARWMLSYPGLALRYLRLPRHDVVLVGYLGHLDVIVIRLLARLRRARVVWDAFLSLYDTVVDDRRLLSRGHPLAWLLWAWEWCACRSADLVLLDTQAQASYFSSSYGVGPDRLGAILVGVEPEAFPPPSQADEKHGAPGSGLVLFYGQLSPLHGVETIVHAARLDRGSQRRWVVIGRGQEGTRIDAELQEHPLPNLTRIPWVPYQELVAWIHQADVCLGIFGSSAKAGRVIPNKVFQVLSAGKPLITRDSPAIRELLSPLMPGVFLVPPGDPEALLEAVRTCVSQKETTEGKALHQHLMGRITPKAVGSALLKLCEHRLAISPQASCECAGG